MSLVFLKNEMRIKFTSGSIGFKEVGGRTVLAFRDSEIYRFEISSNGGAATLKLWVQWHPRPGGWWPDTQRERIWADGVDRGPLKVASGSAPIIVVRGPAEILLAYFAKHVEESLYLTEIQGESFPAPQSYPTTIDPEKRLEILRKLCETLPVSDPELWDAVRREIRALKLLLADHTKYFMTRGKEGHPIRRCCDICMREVFIHFDGYYYTWDLTKLKPCRMSGARSTKNYIFDADKPLERHDDCIRGRDEEDAMNVDHPAA
jgi:hypothetical protein